MNIKHSFLISILIHVSLVSAVLISGNILVVNLNLKQGISSLELSIRGGKKKHDSNSRREQRIKHEVTVLISPAGSFEMTIPNPRKKEKKKAEEQKKMGANSRKMIGALSARASTNYRNQPPRYPFLARKLRYQGKLILSIQVLPNGHAGLVRVVRSSGHDILDEEAVHAAKKWIFFEEGEMQLARPVLIRQEIVFILR